MYVLNHGSWITGLHPFDCNVPNHRQFIPGQFIQCVNEICTEFAFAHHKYNYKLLQIYGSSFYGSNLWDIYSKELMSLCIRWNVAIRQMYDIPVQIHYRLLLHVDLVLKCGFSQFMVSNLRSKHFFIFHIANVCTVSKILNEYDVDVIKLDTAH